MVDAKLLLAAMIQSREAYEEIKRLGTKASGGPLWDSFYRAVEKYYDSDGNVSSVGREYLAAWAEAEFYSNPKHAAAHRQYLDDLPKDISGVAVTELARRVAKDTIRDRLSLACANGSTDEEIEKIIKEYQAVGSGETSTQISSELIDVLDTADLLEEKSDVRFIKLWPKQLNDRLAGGALPGHHVLAFGRPETGKTAFCINLVAGFIDQGLSVLYVSNEEPGADIRDRIRGRLLKRSRQDIRSNRAGAAEAIKGNSSGSLRILGTSSFIETRHMLRRQQGPSMDVVIFDQIRNMRLKSDGRTAELEAAGIEARAIAKEFNVLVVSVTQAGDSATGKVFLEMSDVDSSKTGLPASADLMIGLGCDSAMKANGLMGISLSKNKLSGLHDKFTVSVNFSTGVIS